MRLLSVAAAALLFRGGALGYNNDTFNYRSTTGRDFGPEDWDQVTCDDPGTCLGWPDGYESRVGWNFTLNRCHWCPEGTNSSKCDTQRQSPINLERSRGIPEHENERICKDEHWMEYLPGSCKWSDIIDNPESIHRNNFLIERHALQIMQPVDSDGVLKCNRQKFPRIDYARGYPNWWHLYQTEVKVPSEHTQDGKQYDAEVQLDHVYSIDFDQREVGKVALFLQGYEGASRWQFLDKLICQWREIEEQTREECCLPSAPEYDGCRNPVRDGCGESFFEPRVSSFDCDAHPNVDYDLMCRDGGCCESPRSDQNYCHGIYDMFGEAMEEVCRDCCNPSKEVGPPAPDHKTYPRIQCSQVKAHLSLMCAAGGCCEGERSDSPYCQHIYENHPWDKIQSICWYCCSISKEVAAELPPPTQEPFDCSAHPDADMERVCQVIGCCSAPRSDLPFCHRTYDRFGADIEPVCRDCCGREVGPATPDHPVHARIQCSTIEASTSLMCNPGGCCEPERSSSAFCEEIYAKYPWETIQSMCWYCCSEPKEAAPPPPPTSFDCSAHADANLERVCRDNGCCVTPKSDLRFCHRTYDRFGDDMASVCNDCCTPSREVGQPTPDHPIYPRIQCSAVDAQTSLMCNPDGCCESEPSDSSFCKGIYDTFPWNEIQSICYYCCSEPKDVGEPRDVGRRRNLRTGRNRSDTRILSEYELVNKIQIDNGNDKGSDSVEDEPYRKWRKGVDDDEARRHLVNFDHIAYDPYRWLQRVETEYYFRYDGRQTVPPCFGKVHWRIMKDPIPVHPEQIRELQRLLAWRIAPLGSSPNDNASCVPETAGRPVEGSNGHVVEVNRPIQRETNLHKTAFCECKDWESEIEADRQWCNITNITERFYVHPYNFD